VVTLTSRIIVGKIGAGVWPITNYELSRSQQLHKRVTHRIVFGVGGVLNQFFPQLLGLHLREVRLQAGSKCHKIGDRPFYLLRETLCD